MSKLDAKVQKEWELLRTTFDVVVPILGDIDLYHKHRSLGKSKKEALTDASSTYFCKYLAYGIFLHRTLT